MIRYYIRQILSESLDPDNSKIIKSLKKDLEKLNDMWYLHTTTSAKRGDEWEKRAEELRVQFDSIHKQLYNLTGDPSGITKQDRDKKKQIPKGLDAEYKNPWDLPKKVYDYILINSSLLTSDATDAVRWSRIIDTENDQRYLRGEITIYRAVEGHDDIRPGDWVTTQEKYAMKHNEMYFDGRGNIVSMDVDGRDVLVSPTGNSEEAIYAPMKYSGPI